MMCVLHFLFLIQKLILVGFLAFIALNLVVSSTKSIIIPSLVMCVFIHSLLIIKTPKSPFIIMEHACIIT